MATTKRRYPYCITVPMDPDLRALFLHYATSEGRSFSEAGAFLIAQGLRALYQESHTPLPLPLQRFYEKPPKKRMRPMTETHLIGNS